MEELSKLRELHAAFLCLKPTVADDITSVSELKYILQYAGFNPSPELLRSLWVEGKTSSITYEECCKIAQELTPVTKKDIKELFSFLFPSDNDLVKVDLFNNMLRSHLDDMYGNDFDDLIQRAAVDQENISINELCRIIIGTIADIKELSLQALKEKSEAQRIDSRTYTKKQSNASLHIAKGQSDEFENWNSSSLRGCFFLEKDVIISHQYSLEITETSAISMKIKQNKYNSSSIDVDTLAFLFKESGKGDRTLVGYTDLRMCDGSYHLKSTLNPGKYIIVPFTSGCLLKERDEQCSEKLSLINCEGGVTLSKEFLTLLSDIFHQLDLDGNLYLNRQEFNLYNWRTSGEIVKDDEWAAVENNFDVINGELTKEGFIELHQLEAVDNGGDSDDLWLSLEAMGFNKGGIQDEAAPFSLSVYFELSKPFLSISGLRSGGLLLDKAMMQSVMEKANPQQIGKDYNILKYVHIGSYRASIVIQNKSSLSVSVRIDCSTSDNCITNRPSLSHTVEVNEKSAILAHHLMPRDIRNPWKVICHASINSVS